ncbi:hypothetical protein BC937DRAFT_91081 [Endogone sp. FLAS-F59071]|nr:hypothetical protein BC937DRAFT_91081 [Endogone sp. FLAS-F59071]|eukprot:RUS16551.1 hypothetical protein BC937DRAFT_91081 [Endogone sp. FLAS-F59071]
MSSSCPSSSDESNFPPPSGQRGHYGAACVRCRELKQKCDGSVSSCHRCATAGARCLRMCPEEYYDFMNNNILELQTQFETIHTEWSSVYDSYVVAQERGQTKHVFQNSGWQQESTSPSKNLEVEEEGYVPPLALNIDESCLMTGKFSGADFLPFVDDEGFSPETSALHERLFECRLAAIRSFKDAHESDIDTPNSYEKREKKYEWELEVTPTGLRIQTDIHSLGDLHDFLTTSAHCLSPHVQEVMKQSM